MKIRIFEWSKRSTKILYLFSLTDLMSFQREFLIDNIGLNNGFVNFRLLIILFPISVEKWEQFRHQKWHSAHERLWNKTHTVLRNRNEAGYLFGQGRLFQLQNTPKYLLNIFNHQSNKISLISLWIFITKFYISKRLTVIICIHKYIFFYNFCFINIYYQGIKSFKKRYLKNSRYFLLCFPTRHNGWYSHT